MSKVQEKRNGLSMALWVWECTIPDCEGGSYEPNNHTRARRCGKQHMHNIHNDYTTEPKMIKWDGNKLRDKR